MNSPLNHEELDEHIYSELRDRKVSPLTIYYIQEAFTLLRKVERNYELNRKRVAKHRARKATEDA